MRVSFFVAVYVPLLRCFIHVANNSFSFSIRKCLPTHAAGPRLVGHWNQTHLLSRSTHTHRHRPLGDFDLIAIKAT
eukprot:scaffold9773_cov151-Skeletonema_marinoi.AAC.9